MSRRYEVTPAAKTDLTHINDYLRDQSIRAAIRVRRKLRDAMRMLAAHPTIGHVREDLADEPVRFWPVYSYLIIYRPETKPLQILRVLHASRDIRKLLA